MAAYDGEKLLHRANQFADAKLRSEIDAARASLSDELDARIAQAKASDEKSIRRVRAAYAQHLDDADTGLSLQIKAAEERARRAREAEARKREEDYRIAVKCQNTARKIKEFQDAAKKFSELRGYKDSSAREKACEKQAKALATKAKRRKNTIIISAVAVLVIVVASTLLVTQIIIPSNHYKAAEALLAANDYDGAINEFQAAGKFKDAASRIPATHYAEAEALLAKADYNGAISAFEAAGNYKDAEERILATHYAEAEAMEEAGEVTKAAIAFGNASDYSDAAERSRALWDQIAERNTIAAGNYHTVGLKSDGTVVAVGNNYNGQCDVSGWRGIRVPGR